jgi:hypothetical protein
MNIGTAVDEITLSNQYQKYLLDNPSIKKIPYI